MSLIRARYRAVNTIMNLPRGGGFVGLLDLFPNAAAAYSLRLLRKNYSGGLARVRAWDGVANQGEAEIMPRRIDAQNYVIDLNSKLDDLDATAISRGLTTNDTLADLVLSGTLNYDGLVSGWRDQSLSNDATQTTAANQPKIVSSGSLVTENSKAAIDFDGTDDYLTLGGTNDAGMLGNISVFSVNKAQSSTAGAIVATGLSAATSPANDIQWALNSRVTYYGFTTSDGTSVTNGFKAPANYGSQLLVSATNDESGNAQIFIDGSVGTALSAVAPMNDAAYPLEIGRDPWRSSLYFTGTMQELILYPSLPNRLGIETNINNFYSIY